MNDGGSALGGNQTSTGGTDAPILQNSPLNQTPPPSSASSNEPATSENPQQPTASENSSNPTDLPIDSPNSHPDPTFDSLDTPSYNQSASPTPATDPYTQEFLNSLQVPDSVVEGSGPQKPKTGLIIAVVIAVIILVGVSIAAFLSFSNTPSTPTIAQNQSDPTPSSLFYTYANDLLYGTDSTDPIGDQEDEYYGYNYTKKIFNGPESNQKYFDSIYQKFNTFYQSLRSSGITSGNLYDAATDYKLLLDFLKINPSSETFSYENVRESYLENGEDAAKNTANDILSRIPKNNKYANSFLNFKTNEFNDEIEYLFGLNAHECIEEGVIDPSCEMEFNIMRVSELQQQNQDQNQSENQDDDQNNSETLNNADDLLNSYYRSLGSKCWDIKKAIEESS